MAWRDAGLLPLNVPGRTHRNQAKTSSRQPGNKPIRASAARKAQSHDYPALKQATNKAMEKTE